ncbi:MAG: hypothetical protein NTV86_20955 [Planctomycetota bacterium]|nr:hypothetical protein [Planctomycetota bacterium]
MSQFGSDPGSALTVKPQSNIYTLLVGIVIVGLLVTLVLVLHSLLTPVAEGGYGLEFGAIFDPSKLPNEAKGILPAGPK